MHQTKAGGSLNLHNTNSPNARRSIAESNKRYEVIVGIGWRVVVTNFALNCMHMQAVVQVMKVIVKTTPLQQQQIAISLLAGLQLLKQLQISS